MIITVIKMLIWISVIKIMMTKNDDDGVDDNNYDGDKIVDESR